MRPLVQVSASSKCASPPRPAPGAKAWARFPTGHWEDRRLYVLVLKKKEKEN